MRKAVLLLWLKAAILLALPALSGCGQRGPLYLPEDTSSPPVEEQNGDENPDDPMRD